MKICPYEDLKSEIKLTAIYTWITHNQVCIFSSVFQKEQIFIEAGRASLKTETAQQPSLLKAKFSSSFLHLLHTSLNKKH